MTNRERDRFRALVGESLGIPADRVTLFARGRVALYAILRAMSVGPGDEVILPAFTCVAVPNAIMYTGARPVWADIDPRTLCLDPSAAEALIGSRTKAILAQNTFGLSADLDELQSLGVSRDITVIDDCAHGLGGTYRGAPNGATAPFSFFSTQWSKPISTGLGGIAVDRDGSLARQLHELELIAAEPSALRAATLRTLLMARERAGRGRIFRAGRSIYRAIGRRSLVPGSSSQDELEGTEMPPGFLAGMSESQARLGSERFSRLPDEIERRRDIAHRYSAHLLGAGREPAAEFAQSRHVFLRYPLRVADRQRFLGAAEQSGIDLGDWFVSPVHPVVRRLDRWGYTAGSAPRAEQACAEIVNLPTDPTLTDAQVDRVLAFLSAQSSLIA